MSDKRSVATDALATLGTIIDETAKRDAIHLAVIPMEAKEQLRPGDHVQVNAGGAVRTTVGDGVGIVDPFLHEDVRFGQIFWLVLYPRTITSLRHVWTHPAFSDNDTVEVGPPPDKAASEKWLRDYCTQTFWEGYDEILLRSLAVSKLYLKAIERAGDADYITFPSQASSGAIPAEFWDHAEVVLGFKINHRPTWFECDC